MAVCSRTVKWTQVAQTETVGLETDPSLFEYDDLGQLPAAYRGLDGDERAERIAAVARLLVPDGVASHGGEIDFSPRGVGAAMDWPKSVGDHRVTKEWECANCGASFDCLDQFRSSECEG